MTKEMEEMLSKANTLREGERYGDASKIYTECMLRCVGENDIVGMIHALGGQSLIYKHHARKNSLVIYRNLTLAFAQEEYRIAEKNKDKLDGRTASLAYRDMGDALLMNENIKEALPYFEKALSVSTANICEKGHLKAHIGGVKYLIGDKEEGVKIIKEALDDIRTGDMNTYAPRVWETGCLNKLAIASALEGDKEEALKTINESIRIAEEHNLSIRLREAKEIKEKIEQGRTDFSL